MFLQQSFLLSPALSLSPPPFSLSLSFIRFLSLLFCLSLTLSLSFSLSLSIYIYIYIYKHVRLKTTDCFLFKNLQVETFVSSGYFPYVWIKMLKKVPYTSPSAFDHFAGDFGVLGSVVALLWVLFIFKINNLT